MLEVGLGSWLVDGHLSSFLTLYDSSEDWSSWGELMFVLRVRGFRVHLA